MGYVLTSIGAVAVMLHSARVSDGRLLFGWSMGSREGGVLCRLYVLLLISLIEIVSYMGFFFFFSEEVAGSCGITRCCSGWLREGGKKGSWMGRRMGKLWVA